MILHIKNMVSNRCKIVVKSELQKLGFSPLNVELGQVVIREYPSLDQQNNIKASLANYGFELIINKEMELVENIKKVLTEFVYNPVENVKTSLSEYIKMELPYNYNYLAKLFSDNQNITLEHYYIALKMERVKELLIYEKLSITDIADKLNYSSVAHLSNQFKKMTGLNPSQYKNLKKKVTS